MSRQQVFESTQKTPSSLNTSGRIFLSLVNIVSDILDDEMTLSDIRNASENRVEDGEGIGEKVVRIGTSAVHKVIQKRGKTTAINGKSQKVLGCPLFIPPCLFAPANAGQPCSECSL
ncbi:MAG: hypothetical protein P8O20_08970 [Bacteroidia bacterium]|nr:hypothetical protein [Bacteroidia bacterium]